MKALFCNPPWWVETSPDRPAVAGVRAGSRWPFTLPVRSRPDRFVFGDYLPYPFFLGAAASYAARETGAHVVFRDSLALRESYESFLDYLRREDFDCLVFESATPSWPHDAALIARIHERQPRTRIILTGPIACLGQSLLDEHPLFAVIQGEYEKGSVRALAGQGGLHPHDLLTRAEFDAAPHPHFDRLHAHRYCDHNPRGQRFPQAQVLSSRGCPYRCIFCVWPAVMTGNDPDGTGKRTVRRHSPERMEDFLSGLVGRYGFESVYFDDDTFNLGDAHVEGLCRVMRTIKRPWSAMCRADTVSRETWGLMRASGCFGVKIGFESGNQWVLDNIVGKDLNLEKARETVLHLKELGFTVHGTFTVGLPGETPAQRADTERYRRSLPLDSWQVSGTARIEGSPLAALERLGGLSRYAGASLDGYVSESDGTRKFQRLSRQEPASCGQAGDNDQPPAVRAETLRAMAREADRAGDLTAATGLLARAVQADPTDPRTCLELAEVLSAQGLTDQAALCRARAKALKEAAAEPGRAAGFACGRENAGAPRSCFSATTGNRPAPPQAQPAGQDTPCAP